MPVHFNFSFDFEEIIEGAERLHEAFTKAMNKPILIKSERKERLFKRNVDKIQLAEIDD